MKKKIILTALGLIVVVASVTIYRSYQTFQKAQQLTPEEYSAQTE